MHPLKHPQNKCKYIISFFFSMEIAVKLADKFFNIILKRWKYFIVIFTMSDNIEMSGLGGVK